MRRVVILGHSLKTLVLILGVILLSACSSVNYKEEAEHFLNSAPEPVQISRPTPEEWVLQNGLQVMFVRDDELPIVSGTLFIRAGSLHESRRDRGIVSTMGAMMRQGGTESLPPTALDERLRELAAQVSASFGNEYGTISFNALSSDVSEVFPIFRDIALHPRFDEDRLSLYKTQSLESIRRRKDDPVTVSRVTSNYLLYRKSTRGVLESRDVKRFSRLALLRAHREFVRPDGATLVVTGDISRASLETLVKKHFSDWQPRGSLLPEPPSPPKPYPPGIYIVEGDYSQANINAVQPGPDRHTPDRYAIRLLNNIVGDGLDSRLAKKIRADLGLAYTVYGVIYPGFQEGSNLLFIQTKSDTTYLALSKAFEELQAIQDQPPLSREFETMQLGAQANFVFRFTSPEQIVERMVILEMLGYDEDYDETYIENIFSVSPKEVSEVASRWWDLTGLRIVVVANHDAIEKIEAGVKNHPLLSQYPLRKISFDEIPRGLS